MLENSPKYETIYDAANEKEIQLFNAISDKDFNKCEQLLKEGVDFVSTYLHPQHAELDKILPAAFALFLNTAPCLQLLLQYGAICCQRQFEVIEKMLNELKLHFENTNANNFKFYNNTDFAKNDGFIFITTNNNNYFLIYTEKDFLECIKNKNYQFVNESKLIEQLSRAAQWYQETTNAGLWNCVHVKNLIQTLDSFCKLLKDRKEVINTSLNIAELAKTDRFFYRLPKDIAACISARTADNLLNEKTLYSVARDYSFNPKR